LRRALAQSFRPCELRESLAASPLIGASVPRTAPLDRLAEVGGEGVDEELGRLLSRAADWKGRIWSDLSEGTG
jgi:hypothetical protein